MQSTTIPAEVSTVWGVVAAPNEAVRIGWRDAGSGHWETADYPHSRSTACKRMVRFLGERTETHLHLSESGSALWVSASSTESRRRIERFRHRPTLLLQDGDTVKAVALWALSGVLSRSWTMDLNARLAYHLGCPRERNKVSLTDPLRFTFRVPFCQWRGDKQAPVNVVEHNPTAIYGAKELAGWLPRPPAPRYRPRHRE